MIVVATADFELYHEAVDELRSRGVSFTTVEPGDPLPEHARVLITGPDDEIEANIERVTATGDDARRAVDEALTTLRGGGGRTIVGVDPGIRPGIAVLSGETVVAAFHVPLTDAVEVIRREIEDAVNPVVRIGDGARIQGAKLINDLDGVAVELVDETGTTPYLGSGARGMGDVLAAVNIAQMSGEDIDSREIEPTAGELQRIKDRSREASEESRSIDDELARRVASGELSIEEALAEHRARGE
ncbi:hypothetical protein C440_03543 [Haloferax mucosum ATCC BAA-1512]|uniref:Uncharacterized protein n=1 Tax=Haloferax mucosum ATCC BAA-1512 TaxID=662479 RepID=M0IJ34_9EURY|nr:hypothetical protein [Haloferax mucosum]ELZ96816.1 hypothetical protein C440_03543 [Haloferax mucosum ATCC BAA-1512]